ncbi:MAG: AAA family ATPase [Gammaproteobacteria bacterium]|nr:AAA family ATPase [Gammaproteobacteria bacterium]
MYKSFYGFKEKPFSMLPDPGFLYPSKKHRIAQTLLEYGLMNQVSFCVVTGGIGTGKTTLLRHLLQNMDKDITVGMLSNTHSSFGELLEWILMAFNLEVADKSKVSMFRAFSDFLIGEYAKGRRTVLIIDEAQNMGPKTLEELRMLSNINSEKDQLLQMVLVGQPGLRDMLQDPSLEQFAQRIGVDYHLEALTQDETESYIRHRLSIAGGDENIFTQEACDIVFDQTGGIPRLINQICDTALVYGFAEQAAIIDVDIVNDVASERQKGGILPTRGTVRKTNRVATNLNSISDDVKHSIVRVAVVTESQEHSDILLSSIKRSGMEVVAVLPFNEKLINALDENFADILLVDLDEETFQDVQDFEGVLNQIMDNCSLPVFFNDGSNNDDIDRNIQNISRTFEKENRIKEHSTDQEFSNMSKLAGTKLN